VADARTGASLTRPLPLRSGAPILAPAASPAALPAALPGRLAGDAGACPAPKPSLRTLITNGDFDAYWTDPQQQRQPTDTSHYQQQYERPAATG
jgi:hypothetical protein